MTQSGQSPMRATFRSLVLIALVVGGGAAAFAYTAGWLSPQRLTPDKMVDAFAPPTACALGHRRNHAKGICFTGAFEANGAGSALSQAQVFARGQYPALGRFNLGTADPNAPDATVRVRGMGLQITTPDGQEWRTAMINAPVFAVSTPQAFYELLRARRARPRRDEDIRCRAPRVRAIRRMGRQRALDRQLRGRAIQQPQQLRLHQRFRRRSTRCDGRCVPAAQPVAVSPDDLAKRGPDFLEQEIAERVDGGPVRWTMVVTVANPGDPTADPTKAWPRGSP